MAFGPWYSIMEGNPEASWTMQAMYANVLYSLTTHTHTNISPQIDYTKAMSVYNIQKKYMPADKVA